MRRATSCFVLVLATVLLALTASRWTVAQEDVVGDVVPPAAESDVVEATESEPIEFENEQEESYEDDYEEAWDGDEDGEEDEHECDDEIEADMLLLELRATQAEHAHMVAEISTDHAGTVSWIISDIQEYLDEAQAVEFLQRLLIDVKDINIRRLIQLKLIELHADLDQVEQVKEQLRQLVLGQ